MSTKLHVVTPDHSGIKPPAKLGPHGRHLWEEVMLQYAVADVGGQQLLALGCAALDRAESCREAIAKDGQIIKTRHGPKEHPLLKIELANRAFLSRVISKLGIDTEPVRSSVGKPPGSFGRG